MSFCFATDSRMDPRLTELYTQLQDGDVRAIDQLEAEAIVDWLPALHEWLERPDDFFLREATAPAVIRLEGLTCLPRLIAALRLGFAEGHDCDSLQSYVFSLLESSPAKAASMLVPMATSTSEQDRADAAWLLGFVSSECSPDLFLRLASDESPKVRRTACGSLASFKGLEPIYEMLVHRLADTDEDVRIAAASSLGYFKDRRALPLLERWRNSWNVSERATHILDFSIESLRKL